MSHDTDQGAALVSIQTAVARYCSGLDQLNAEVMKLAYWSDAVDERFGDSAWDFVDHTIVVHEPFTWTMHCLHNHVVEFDPEGTTARGELYVTAYLRSEDPATLTTFFGRYLDRYQRRDDTWRILRRACIHEGSQTAPAAPAAWSFEQLRQGKDYRGSPGTAIGL